MSLGEKGWIKPAIFELRPARIKPVEEGESVCENEDKDD